MNREFETLREEMEQALGGLDAQQTQLRPGGDPARWSIQQTMGHLLLTYAATERAVDARISKGTATLARPTFVQRAAQAVVVGARLFPPGRKAPEMVCPAPDEVAVPSGVLIERVTAALSSLDLKMMAAEKLFGREQRAIRHIVLGPLSVCQWRQFHLVHARHHVKFIAQVRGEFVV